MDKPQPTQPKRIVPPMKAIIAASFVAVLVIASTISLTVARAQSYDSYDRGGWVPRGWSGDYWGQSYDDSSAYGPGAAYRAPLRRGYPTVSLRNIAAMKAAIARYQRIVARGGWKPIPRVAVKIGLRPGMRHPVVALLRRRLEATGDLQPGYGASIRFDYYLERALRRFQLRHGLEPTGDLVDRSRRRNFGTRTLIALNVPARARLQQLRANLRRIRNLAPRVGKRYVLVNIPAAQVEAVENDRVVSRHVAVVGKPGRASPILSSAIHQINFNPSWTLPPTVIREDLIPKGRQMQRRNQSVLERYGIDAYASPGGRKLNPRKINWFSPAVYNYMYRQEPGPENPLGFVKINFHNKYAVYLHDTPSKTIFGRNDRAASSGCVRVQNIERLVTWLLDEKPGWSRRRVAMMRRTGARKDVNLSGRTKIHFAYITAWATPDGVVNFRRDLYGRDQRFGVSRMAAAY